MHFLFIQFYAKALEVFPYSVKKDYIKISKVTTALAKLIARNSSRIPEAIELTEKAISFNGNNAAAHHTRGALLSKLGKYKEAIMEMQRSIELNSTQHEYIRNLIRASYIHGDTSTYVKWLRILLKLKPYDEDATLKLSRFILENSKDKKNFTEAKIM